MIAAGLAGRWKDGGMRASGRQRRGVYPAAMAAILVTMAGAARAAGPSFDCGQVEPGSIEALVCRDEGLAAADLTLAALYKQALEQAGNERPPLLKATQRGWIKGR